jgi:hypothetical protein
MSDLPQGWTYADEGENEDLPQGWTYTAPPQATPQKTTFRAGLRVPEEMLSEQPPMTMEEQDQYERQKAQHDLLMEPVRLVREAAGGLAKAGTDAYYGLTRTLPAYLGGMAGGEGQANRAALEADAERKAALAAQDEVLAAEPSLLTRGMGAVAAPAIQKADEALGGHGVVPAAAEIVGDIALGSAALKGASKVIPKRVPSSPKRVTQRGLLLNQRGGVMGAEVEAQAGASALKNSTLPSKSVIGEGQLTAGERLAMTKTLPEADKFYVKGPSKRLEEATRKVAPRRPSDIQSPNAALKAMQDNEDAFVTVAKYRDQYTLQTGKGSVTGQTPKTPQQAIDAAQQTADALVQIQDDIVKSATGRGLRVPTDDLIASLEEMVSPRAFGEKGASPQMMTTAKRWLDLLQPIKDRGFSAKGALEQLKNLNNDISAVFKGQNANGDSVATLAAIASDLRRSLNKTLESVTGDEVFAATRRDLGKVLDLQNRLLRKVEQEANKAAAKSYSIFDLISVEQAIRGLARGKLSGLTESAGTYMFGKSIKYLNGHDRSIQKAFTAAKNLSNNETVKPYTATDFVGEVAPKYVRDKVSGVMMRSDQGGNMWAPKEPK